MAVVIRRIFFPLKVKLCLLWAIFVVTAVMVLPAHARQTDASTPTVVSLDECADQYVMGLMPRTQVLALSNHAQLPDSNFRDRARGLPRVRPTLEAILSLHPQAVIRTWGGDAKLLQALQRYGIKIIGINDVSSYAQARDELFRVGHELNQDASAGIEAHRFDSALRAIVPFGHNRTVLYYTTFGYSAGPDTMVGDMLQRLGFRLETQDKGYTPLPPEVLLSLQPDVFALGFYDDPYGMRRVPGRHPLVRDYIAHHRNFTLPQTLLSCSGWFTAYDLQALSDNEAKFEAAQKGGMN